jgi:uncharacterized damage-inducible protein DinB
VTPETAEAVRAHNAALDAELRALAGEVPAEALGRDPGGDEWTVAQLLAHLGEFPRFFADDLSRWLDDPATPVGRTVEHPARLAAVEEAQSADLTALRSEMDAAFAALETVLDRLDDEHLRAQAQNRKYGPEPLTTYLDRYVLGHKASHVEQLRTTLAAVR